tara:strand:- start:1302 stop:2009 length:708 start_codon:yes stop_codon:yes gene_type:complete
MTKSKEKIKVVLNDLAEAKTLRATAKELESPPCNDPLGAAFMRQDADCLEYQAKKELQINESSLPQVGTGGELTISNEQAIESPKLINTVDKPDSITAEASRDRLELMLDVDCIGMGVDAAETIQAENSLEKMLAHQLATAHKLAMSFAKQALNYLNKPNCGPYDQNDAHAIEGARAANTSAKLMDVYQKGILALSKVRTGGKQTVTVQHVNVADGGQAVVTGDLNAGVKDEKKQ